MRITQAPLSAAETQRIIQLFELCGAVGSGTTRGPDDIVENAGALGLAFARGVFAATATAPTQLQPEQWLPLVLGTESTDPATLRELLALVMREYNSCADCLTLGVPAVPAGDETEAVRQFCRGYVQIAQRDKKWTTDSASFELTLPLMVLSGYADDETLAKILPDAAGDRPSYEAKQSRRLIHHVAQLYQHFEQARQAAAEASQAPAVSDKVGRNDPCPCGSGKKYKKCCGQA